MNFSAARSSSPVVTPGRIFPARRSIVRTRMAPAAAIFSISAGDFLMIIAVPMVRRSQPLFEAQRGERRADVVVDLDLVARTVESAQQPALLVVALQGLGELVVRGEPLLHLLRLVVLALRERAAALVAHAVLLG